jgi:plastocyanin
MKRIIFLSALLTIFCATSAQASDYVITIKDNAFSPAELVVPAGEKIKVTVKNLDKTPAEFESYDLNREKIVTPEGQIVVFLGPLDAGTYTYFDDFHRDTAKATIKAQ